MEHTTNITHLMILHKNIYLNENVAFFDRE